MQELNIYNKMIWNKNNNVNRYWWNLPKSGRYDGCCNDRYDSYHGGP